MWIFRAMHNEGSSPVVSDSGAVLHAFHLLFTRKAPGGGTRRRPILPVRFRLRFLCAFVLVRAALGIGSPHPASTPIRFGSVGFLPELLISNLDLFDVYSEFPLFRWQLSQQLRLRRSQLSRPRARTG